jgi:NAD-dependent protein deacetylase/lipoamidase
VRGCSFAPRLDSKLEQFAEILYNRSMVKENDEPTDVLPLERQPLTACRNIVVLTGAGVSVASGIRGPGGLRNDPEIEKLAFREALDENPIAAWQFCSDIRKMSLNAKPNAAHLALARFEKNLRPDQQFLLITQNVDGLHQRAGSRNIVEIHGSIHRSKCSDYSCFSYPFEDDKFYDPTEKICQRVYRDIPHCRKCGPLLCPDMMMFGEMISPHISVTATAALKNCDLFIAIGTSGSVFPANQCVRAARAAGARTIYINMEPLGSAMEEPIFDEMIIGKAEEMLPKLMGKDPDWYEPLEIVFDLSVRIGKPNRSLKRSLIRSRSVRLTSGQSGPCFATNRLRRPRGRPYRNDF